MPERKREASRSQWEQGALFPGRAILICAGDEIAWEGPLRHAALLSQAEGPKGEGRDV